MSTLRPLSRPGTSTLCCLVLLWMAALVASCSSSSPADSGTGEACETAEDCDSGLCIAGECAESPLPDTSDNGLGGQTDVGPSTSDQDPGESTEDIEGGLGADCANGDDCISGVCLNGADGRFCTDFCDGECPEGWECRIFSSSGSDFTSYCLPVQPVLCSTCTSDLDCGGLNDFCLELLDGRFCGIGCDQTDEVPCPDGYSCREMAIGGSSDGVLQCVPDLEICGGCLDLDQDGYGVGPTCLGPDCDDGDPSVNPGMPEICDGRDTNCDGTVDSGFDKTSDINHCGVCDNVCQAPGGTPACVDGVCGIESCDEGRENCDGELDTGCEVDLTSDTANCGTCGWACEASRANMVCDEGSCAIASCTDNYDNCDGELDTGCETLLLADDNHCGECENACPDFQICVNGSCILDNCPAGTGSCDGDDTTGCETTFGSMEHCSRCNDTCTGGEVCDEGSCQCPAGTIRCTDGTCAPENACGGCAVLAEEPGTACGYCDTGVRSCDGANSVRCTGATNSATDAENCGSCGLMCPPDTICFGGECQCSGGQTLCGITCVNRNTDPENCGACGDACFFTNASASCTAGNCVLAGCSEGFRNCDGNQATGCETNVSNNIQNCGTCGNACNLPNTTSNGCANGQCTIGDCSDGFRNCDGSQATGCETNTQSSSEHCGSCGNNCTGGQICSGGECDCPAGQVLVGGVCTNETTGSVITLPTTNRQQTGARLNAEITSVGTPSVTSRGFCWAAAPMVPTIDTAWSTCQTVQGTPTVGTYNLTISSLTAATQYRARAWIRRDTNDPVYGDTIQFASCQTTDQPSGTDQNCDGVDGQEDIAIFVRSNGSSGSACGTRASPCNSIALGLQRAQATGRTHVYVAAGTFAEQVTLPQGISLWGGLNSDFSLWNPEAHVTHISSTSPIGVLVDGRTTAGTLSGFRITAANASGATASSRAIVLRNVTGNFVVEHNDVRPGRGRDGTGGSNGSSGNTGRNGSNGGGGSGGSSGAANEGAGGSGCLTGFGCSNGGNGGRGGHGLNNGQNGANGGGSSGPVGSFNPGSGGRGGEHRSSCPSNNPAQNGLVGRAGTTGGTGNAGTVPSNQNRGSLSGALDWTATAGLSGQTGGAGIAGGGGGGGGGGRCTTNNRQGGGGGGGGAGGSGGLGGAAGTGGGGSIGILAINASGATVRNNSGQMQLGGTGGVGGNGGFGGSGGSPGAGGLRYNSRAGNGAAGGSGGTGGRGGGGSGGAGGASVGLLMINSGTLTHANNNFTTATPASGGSGGQPNGSTGANGLSVPVLAL